MILSAGKHPVAPTATMATITSNFTELPCTHGDTPTQVEIIYEKMYRGTINVYNLGMTEDIEEALKHGDYNKDNEYDWRDNARQELVNTNPMREIDFVTELDYVMRNHKYHSCLVVTGVISKMTRVVVKYNQERFGEMVDPEIFGDMGKLYSMWIYAVTDEVQYEIEYEE